MMIDSLQKCNDRITQLRASYRGRKGITFRVEESTETDKFKAKPLPGAYRGGGYATYPKVVK